MSGQRQQQEDRLLDLLVEQATQGLSAEHERELERLTAQYPDVDVDGPALGAAAVDLGYAASGGAAGEPMPDDLRRRIQATASDHLPARVLRHRQVEPATSGFSPGWLAAAAMLIFALFGWFRGPGTPSPVPSPSLDQQRSELLAAVDAIRVDWSRPDDPAYAGVEGDVVWSPGTQRGFMRLRGLPSNDPSREQYQLWIVDPDRDKNPVDGGVFDVPRGVEELIIPIDAKLEVLQAQAFALTLEQPGGVVVSDGPLLVVAPVSS